jgi:hypothetical protein
MFSSIKFYITLAIAGIVLFIIVGLHLRVDSLKASVSEEQTRSATLQAEWEKCKVADKSKEISLAACNDNVEHIRQANAELQVVLEQSRVYKKKWKQVTAEQAELPPPTDGEPCLNGGKIDEGHKAIISAAYSDLANYYSVRRKIKRPDAADGDRAGAPKVLPAAAGDSR